MENIKASNLNEGSSMNKLKDPIAEIGLSEMSHSAGRKLGTMTSNFTNSANEYVKNGRNYVVENPGKGVAIAAATGLVVGGLVTYALSRRHQ